VTQNQPAVKRSPEWFLGGFHRFLNAYLRRHFHAVAVERDSRPAFNADPATGLLVYANHPSWWDPLIAHFLNRALFPGRHFHAPIDAEALEQYRVFEKLGFFGVKLATAAGAATFLKTSTSILRDGSAALWITPEGRFCDVRDHTASWMPGLAHLCSRNANVLAVPLALEYVFWEERLPVCLVALGHTIASEHHPDWSKRQWNDALHSELRGAQTRLAQLAIARSPEPFDNLLPGTSGGGWVYDSCRRAKAWVTGRPFKPSHGDHFQ